MAIAKYGCTAILFNRLDRFASVSALFTCDLSPFALSLSPLELRPANQLICRRIVFIGTSPPCNYSFRDECTRRGRPTYCVTLPGARSNSCARWRGGRGPHQSSEIPCNAATGGGRAHGRTLADAAASCARNTTELRAATAMMFCSCRQPGPLPARRCIYTRVDDARSADVVLGIFERSAALAFGARVTGSPQHWAV